MLSAGNIKEQECIPVGCVPPAAVAVTGGVSTSPPRSRHPPAPDPPPLGTGTPLGTRPPPREPGTRPPLEQAPPAARHARIPLAMHAGILLPPPWTDAHV